MVCELVHAKSVGAALHYSGMLIEILSSHFSTAKRVVLLVVEALTSVVTTNAGPDFQTGPEVQGPSMLDDVKEVKDALGGTRIVTSISNLFKRAWAFSKELVAACASVLLAMAAFAGTLCPDFKPARRVLAKFLETVKLSKAVQHAKEVNIVDMDAFSNVVNNVLFTQDLQEPWKTHHDNVDELEAAYKQDALAFATNVRYTSKMEMMLEELTDYKTKTMPTHVVAVVTDDYRRLVAMQQHVKQIRSQQVSRVKPVCLVLAGDPGVGKSTLIGQIAKRINSKFGVEGFDSWTCSSDHHDELAGKPVLVMDEFGLKDLERDSGDLQCIVDTAAYHPNMDMIQNKTFHIAPRVVIVCTNHVNIFAKCKFPQALSRRIFMHVLVTNDALHQHKMDHFGDNPSDAVLDKIFRDNPSQLWKLPAGAVDWIGGCYDIQGVKRTKAPSATDMDTIVNEIKTMCDVHETKFKDAHVAKFQVKHDRGIFLFSGPPGTGKTTLADTIDDVTIYDDPQRSKDTMDAFLKDVLDDSLDHKVLVTANLPPLMAALDERGSQMREAFMRRVVTHWEFTYRKKGYIYGRYTAADVAECGWSRAVEITCKGTPVDNGHARCVISEFVAAPKFDYVLPPYNPDYMKVLASVDCDLTDVRTLSLTQLYRAVAISDGIDVQTIGSLFYHFSDVPRDGIISSPESACHAINGRNINCALPCGLVQMRDVTFQVVGTNPLQVTLLPQDVPRPNPPADIYKMDDDLVGAIIATFGSLIGLIGISLRLKTKEFQSDDAYDAGLRGVRTNRKIEKMGYPKHQDVELSGAWGDDTTIDYNEKIVFESNVPKYIYPAFGSNGDRLAWCLSTKEGVYMNRHTVEVCRKIGSEPLGSSTVTGAKLTDVVVVVPDGQNRLSRLSCGLGVPVLGETIYRVDSDGTEVPYTVVTRRVVSGPSNNAIQMWVLQGQRTQPGDCGLPYIRRFKSNIELLGLHSGMVGDQIMMSPIRTPCEFQVGRGEGKTFLYETQFVGINQSKWLPACKVSTDDNLAREDIIITNATPFFANVKDKLLEVDYETAVIDSMEYMRNLVPDWNRWSWRAALKSLDWSTSAGPSYKSTKNEVFDASGDPFPKWEKVFFRDLKTLTASCEIVVKDEMRKMSKIEQCSSRLIFSFDVGQVVQAKMYTGSIQKQLIDSVGSHYSAVGVSYMAGTWGEIATNLERYPHLVDADFAAWDKSMSRCMIDQVIRVFTSPIRDDEERRKASDILRFLSSAQTQFGQTRQGLPSGMPCTSHLNSTAHLIMVNAAMALAGYGPYGSDDRVWFTSYGDDFVCGMTDANFLGKLCAVWKMFGFSATNSQKTGPPSIVSLAEIRFLKRAFVKRDDLLWMAPLERDSIEKSLRFTRAPVPYICDGVMREHKLMGNAQSDRLQIAFTEAYQHGKEYYQDLKQRIIDCSSKQKFRLAFCIPNYERFRIRIDPICTEQNQLCVNSVNNPIVVQFQMMEQQQQSSATNVNVEGLNGQDNLIAGIAPVSGDVAAPTVGLEHGVGTTGGYSVIDPAIRERWAPAPGGGFTITTLTTVGTIVWQSRIHPDMNTFTSFLQNIYNAWGGGFDLQIFLGANNFIGGKLGLFFVPPGINPNKLAVDDLLSYPKTIIDIRTCDMMSFSTPDIKKVTWHQVGDDTPDGFGGTAVLVVITNIVSSGADNVTIDGRVMTRPSQEFEFAFLKSGVSTGSGESGIRTYFQQVADALANGSICAIDQSKSGSIVIAPRAVSPINRYNAKSIIKMDGTDLVTGAPLFSYKHSYIDAVIGTQGPATADRRLRFYGADGNLWDPDTNLNSKTLPPAWVGIAPNSAAQFSYYSGTTRVENAVTVTCIANDFYISFPGTPPGMGTAGILRLAPYVNGMNNQAVEYNWTPPNGESIVVWTAFGVNDTLPSPQTTQIQDIFTRVPHDTNGYCILFNLLIGGNLSGHQVKLYPNGVLTSAGTTSALVFSQAPTFQPVGLVGQDYRLPPVVGSAYFRDTSSHKLAWLLQQLLPSLDLSDPVRSEASQILDPLVSMQSTDFSFSHESRILPGRCLRGASRLSQTQVCQNLLPSLVEEEEDPAWRSSLEESEY
uniref:Polyprotein n=1 Tax=Wuhan spiny eel calicivirus 2 TaxID=2116157 RepID=A0A2P1GMK4_9CALI|nr:polyprotein [Wuhan spiny eel calicivirus 2]